MGEAAQEGTMSAKKATQKSTKNTAATGKKSKGFTDDERAAMKVSTAWVVFGTGRRAPNKAASGRRVGATFC
jgi:hypothetical protein